MNVVEPIWTKVFIDQTYSCIKGRGIHKVVKDLKRALVNNVEDTKFCLKMDVRKFYPSVDHEILYNIIKKKIKDPHLLFTLKEIIYSAEGVPIGNYLSQYFANLYLAYFDHWVKEELKCKYYFRYADDLVILHNDKEHLHKILIVIKLYLREVLKLKLKDNYQIFPVESRGIDFVGYKFYHTHILLRKSIKSKIIKLLCKSKSNKINRNNLKNKMQAYFGWLKFCNSKHLLSNIETITNIHFSNWVGLHKNIKSIYHKLISINSLSKYSKYFKIEFTHNHKSYFTISRSKKLLKSLSNLIFPINLKLIQNVRSSKNRRNK